MATKSKSAFGARENIAAAKEAGKIDAFDVIYMTNGEIGWLDKDGNTKINTPRTQTEITASCIESDNVISAGMSLDEVLELLAGNILTTLKAETLAEANTYADNAAGATEVIEF